MIEDLLQTDSGENVGRENDMAGTRGTNLVRSWWQMLNKNSDFPTVQCKQADRTKWGLAKEPSNSLEWLRGLFGGADRLLILPMLPFFPAHPILFPERPQALCHVFGFLGQKCCPPTHNTL